MSLYRIRILTPYNIEKIFFLVFTFNFENTAFQHTEAKIFVFKFITHFLLAFRHWYKIIKDFKIPNGTTTYVRGCFSPTNIKSFTFTFNCTTSV